MCFGIVHLAVCRFDGSCSGCQCWFLSLDASILAQGVATICTTHGHHNPSALPINLSTEAGSIGGVPTGGLRFGASHNAAAHMPCATMIDFYNGGGVDVACLGMAEVSASCCWNPTVHAFLRVFIAKSAQAVGKTNDKPHPPAAAAGASYDCKQSIQYSCTSHVCYQGLC